MFDTRESTFPLQDFDRIAEVPRADNARARACYARFLRSAVRRLPPKQQQVVALYFFGGRSLPAIARELGIDPSTASRRLAAAKQTLRLQAEIVSEAGLFPS